MIAVLYSQPLDMCTLIEVLVVLFQSNNISYRGPLSRTAGEYLKNYKSSITLKLSQRPQVNGPSRAEVIIN